MISATAALIIVFASLLAPVCVNDVQLRVNYCVHDSVGHRIVDSHIREVEGSWTFPDRSIVRTGFCLPVSADLTNYNSEVDRTKHMLYAPLLNFNDMVGDSLASHPSRAINTSTAPNESSP